MIVFDTETTGLIENIAIPLKQQPQIVELCAIKIDDQTLEEVGCWTSLFKVKSMHEDAFKTHGISLEMLRGEPTFAEMFESLCEFFLGERTLIGHNLSFDRDQLAMEIRRLGKACAFPWPYRHVDTVEVTEGWEGFRLGLTKLHEKLFGEGFPEAHRAEADTRATARCVVELVKRGDIVL